MDHLNFEGGIELIELIQGGLQKGLQAPFENSALQNSQIQFEKGLKGGLEKGGLLEGGLRRVLRGLEKRVSEFSKGASSPLKPP